MKNPRVVKGILGLGSVLALTLGLGRPAFAGPSPQFWHQQEKIRAENAAKQAATPAAKAADSPAMACSHCRTKVFEESSFTNVSGKIAPHSTVVGRRHYCDGCRGYITKVRSKVTDEMKRNYPICAKAGPACCSVSA